MPSKRAKKKQKYGVCISKFPKMPAAVYPLIVGSRDRRPGQLDGIVGLLISKELRTPIKAVGIPPPPVNPPNSCCIIIKAHDT